MLPRKLSSPVPYIPSFHYLYTAFLSFFTYTIERISSLRQMDLFTLNTLESSQTVQ